MNEGLVLTFGPEFERPLCQLRRVPPHADNCEIQVEQLLRGGQANASTYPRDDSYFRLHMPSPLCGLAHFPKW